MSIFFTDIKKLIIFVNNYISLIILHISLYILCALKSIINKVIIVLTKRLYMVYKVLSFITFIQQKINISFDKMINLS